LSLKYNNACNYYHYIY